MFRIPPGKWKVSDELRFFQQMQHSKQTTISNNSSGISLVVPISSPVSIELASYAYPQVLKQREEQKRKWLEKQIRRLEKNARQLNPVEELEVPMDMLDEQAQRKRMGIKVSAPLAESRVLLEKQWAKYEMEEKLADYQLIDRVLAVLNELRLESEELYQSVVQVDEGLVPFRVTPPIESYEMPDSEYLDVSNKFE